MVCSSNDIVGQGLQGVDPGADIDGTRAAVVDDQDGRAARDRFGGPGKICLGTAANPEDYFAGAVDAAGGNGENTDGANQGCVPAHDQPLLTMPNCGQHTLSPADRSLTRAPARNQAGGFRDQADGGCRPATKRAGTTSTSNGLRAPNASSPLTRAASS